MNVLFHGCDGRPGHYLHSKDGVHWRYESVPWGTMLDAGLLTNDYYGCDSRPDGKYVVQQKDGWTAVAFWDRSGDGRGGSNSVFLVNAEITGEELITLARQQWPEIFNRPNFPLASQPAQQPK